MPSYSFASRANLDSILSHSTLKSGIAEFTLECRSRPCAVAALSQSLSSCRSALVSSVGALSASPVRSGKETTLQPCGSVQSALLAVAVVACVLLALCACTQAAALCRAALPVVLDPRPAVQSARCVDPVPLAVGVHHGADQAYPVISVAPCLRIPQRRLQHPYGMLRWRR